MHKPFYKPTKTYREYHLLDTIENTTEITQRQLSQMLNTTVSIIHDDLEACVQAGYIFKKHIHKTKAVYQVTPLGLERKKYLNLAYYDAAQKLYDEAKKHLDKFLLELHAKNYHRLVLYGAGEVASMMLRAMRESTVSFHIQAIFDDDTHKQGTTLEDIRIEPFSRLDDTTYDGILVASYAHNQTLYDQLLNAHYPDTKIIRYFT